MTKEEFENLGIGETFQLGCRKFKVMEANKGNVCNSCYFYVSVLAECLVEDIRDEGFIPSCRSLDRKDGKSVIFVEVKNND